MGSAFKLLCLCLILVSIMLYFRSLSDVHSTFSGVVKLHLNCERVERERTRISKLSHSLSVDGKTDSYEHSLEKGISNLFPVLRL